MQELVHAIKAGNRTLFGELCLRNAGLIAKVARRYRWALQADPAVDMEDLLEAGKAALMDAVDLWEPDRGAWSTAAVWCLQRAMRDALGLQRADWRERVGTRSLDAPLSEGGDGDALSLLEVTPDQRALCPEDVALSGDLVRIVRGEVEALPDVQRDVVKLIDLEGLSVLVAAERLGLDVAQVRALRARAYRALRHSWRLRAMDDETRFYQHKSVKAFNSDFTSVVEEAVLWREERRAALEAGGG